MTETVLLRLSGDLSTAREALQLVSGNGNVTVLGLADLRGTRLGLGVPRCDRLGIVGSPPGDQIGYAFAPIVALGARPREVSLIDTADGSVRTQSRRRYLARTGGFTALQLVSSGLAVGAQRALAQSWACGRDRSAPRGGELQRLVYLRPMVGAPVAVGGSITHSHEVIRALTEVGVDVDAVTTDAEIAATAAAEPDPPCEWLVARVPRTLKGLPASAALGGDLALARLSVLKARRADAIYQRHARFSLAGALLARMTGRPLFLEYNGSEAWVARNWQPTALTGQLERCEDAALAAASRIVVVSDAVRRELLERGIQEERIIVSPNAVDASRFGRGDGPELRRELGVGDNELLVGFVGSFGPWHGAPVLARAFARIAHEHPRARLLLVGDGDERAEVDEILGAAGLLGRTLALGRVPPAAVPRHLDACDVLASPHVPLADGMEFFGSPTKLFEYMAAGKAIVASSLGQIGEVLIDERNALLATPGDVEEFAAVLARALEDAQLRGRLGEAARRDAVERHSWRRNAEQLVSAYRKLQRP